MTMPDTPELPPLPEPSHLGWQGPTDGLAIPISGFTAEQMHDYLRADRATRLAAAPQGWKPTPENINALPEPIRQYVMELETLCDPAGIVRENMLLKDCNRGLQLMYRKAADAAPAASSPEAADERAGPLVMTGYQLRVAAEFVNPDPGDTDQLESEVCIQWGPERDDGEGGKEPAGLRVWLADYPEEGSLTLDPDKPWPPESAQGALASAPAGAGEGEQHAPVSPELDATMLWLGETRDSLRAMADRANQLLTAHCRAALAGEPAVAAQTPYTDAIGQAGQRYADSFPHAHPLPALWRWEELWNAMRDAARAASQGEIE